MLELEVVTPETYTEVTQWELIQCTRMKMPFSRLLISLKSLKNACFCITEFIKPVEEYL